MFRLCAQLNNASRPRSYSRKTARARLSKSKKSTISTREGALLISLYFLEPDFFYRLYCVHGMFESSVVESKNSKGDTYWKQTVDIAVTEPDIEYLKVSLSS